MVVKSKFGERYVLNALLNTKLYFRGIGGLKK